MDDIKLNKTEHTDKRNISSSYGHGIDCKKEAGPSNGDPPRSNHTLFNGNGNANGNANPRSNTNGNAESNILSKSIKNEPIESPSPTTNDHHPHHDNDDDDNGLSSYLPFQPDLVGYFHPDLSSRYVSGGVLTTPSSVMIFTDIFAFLARLDDILPIYGPRALRMSLPLLLRGRAQRWYTTFLTPEEKQYLRDPPGLNHWSELLTVRFQESMRSSVDELERATYTLYESVRQGILPQDYIYEAMRVARAAGISDEKVIVGYAYDGIEMALREDMGAAEREGYDTGDKTLRELLAAMENKWGDWVRFLETVETEKEEERKVKREEERELKRLAERKAEAEEAEEEKVVVKGEVQKGRKRKRH